MVKTIQIAQEILRNIESKHDAYFRSINTGILYFVEFREVDGWLTVDIINDLPENIELDIKKGFGIIVPKDKTPKEASTIFHNIIKASVSPKATGSKTAEKKETKPKNNYHELQYSSNHNFCIRAIYWLSIKILPAKGDKWVVRFPY